jgi:BirA family biotin operon repressor/biotin-[acetyl-CoA-carboxylase] ligase
MNEMRQWDRALKSDSKYLLLESCDSTQNQLSLAKDLRAIVALTQSQGRGRLGREWVSTQGQGLYLSWRPDIKDLSFKQIPSLALMIAGSMAELLNQIYPNLNCRIKWPNDLLVGHKKLAGILCEVKSQGPLLDVIVGIGLNLRKQPFEHSISLEELAIKANEELAIKANALDLQDLSVSPMQLKWADLILDHCQQALQDLAAGKIEVILNRWRKYQIPIGTYMKQRDVVGTYLGIDDEGNLRLKSEDGQIIQISSGEVQIASILPSTHQPNAKS